MVFVMLNTTCVEVEAVTMDAVQVTSWMVVTCTVSEMTVVIIDRLLRRPYSIALEVNLKQASLKVVINIM